MLCGIRIHEYTRIDIMMCVNTFTSLFVYKYAYKRDPGTLTQACVLFYLFMCENKYLSFRFWLKMWCFVNLLRFAIHCRTFFDLFLLLFLLSMTCLWHCQATASGNICRLMLDFSNPFKFVLLHFFFCCCLFILFFMCFNIRT